MLICIKFNVKFYVSVLGDLKRAIGSSRLAVRDFITGVPVPSLVFTFFSWALAGLVQLRKQKTKINLKMANKIISKTINQYLELTSTFYCQFNLVCKFFFL